MINTIENNTFNNQEVVWYKEDFNQYLQFLSINKTLTKFEIEKEYKKYFRENLQDKLWHKDTINKKKYKEYNNIKFSEDFNKFIKSLEANEEFDLKNLQLFLYKKLFDNNSKYYSSEGLEKIFFESWKITKLWKFILKNIWILKYYNTQKDKKKYIKNYFNSVPRKDLLINNIIFYAYKELWFKDIDAQKNKYNFSFWVLYLINNPNSNYKECFYDYKNYFTEKYKFNIIDDQINQKLEQKSQLETKIINNVEKTNLLISDFNSLYNENIPLIPTKNKIENEDLISLYTNIIETIKKTMESLNLNDVMIQNYINSLKQILEEIESLNNQSLENQKKILLLQVSLNNTLNKLNTLSDIDLQDDPNIKLFFNFLEKYKLNLSSSNIDKLSSIATIDYFLRIYWVDKIKADYIYNLWNIHWLETSNWKITDPNKWAIPLHLLIAIMIYESWMWSNWKSNWTWIKCSQCNSFDDYVIETIHKINDVRKTLKSSYNNENLILKWLYSQNDINNIKNVVTSVNYQNWLIEDYFVWYINNKQKKNKSNYDKIQKVQLLKKLLEEQKKIKIKIIQNYDKKDQKIIALNQNYYTKTQNLLKLKHLNLLLSQTSWIIKDKVDVDALEVEINLLKEELNKLENLKNKEQIVYINAFKWFLYDLKKSIKINKNKSDVQNPIDQPNTPQSKNSQAQKILQQSILEQQQVVNFLNSQNTISQTIKNDITNKLSKLTSNIDINQLNNWTLKIDWDYQKYKIDFDKVVPIKDSQWNIFKYIFLDSDWKEIFSWENWLINTTPYLVNWKQFKPKYKLIKYKDPSNPDQEVFVIFIEKQESTINRYRNKILDNKIEQLNKIIDQESQVWKINNPRIKYRLKRVYLNQNYQIIKKGIEEISKDLDIPADRITIIMDHESWLNKNVQNLWTYAAWYFQFMPGTIQNLFKAHPNEMKQILGPNFKSYSQIQQEANLLFKNPNGEWKTSKELVDVFEERKNMRVDAYISQKLAVNYEPKTYQNVLSYKEKALDEFNKYIHNPENDFYYINWNLSLTWKQKIYNQYIKLKYMNQITNLSIQKQLELSKLYLEDAIWNRKIDDIYKLGLSVFYPTAIRYINDNNYIFGSEKHRKWYTRIVRNHNPAYDLNHDWVITMYEYKKYMYNKIKKYYK